MKKQYKPCPHCGNEILEAAIKCQYCLKFLKDEKELKYSHLECPYCLNKLQGGEEICPYCDEILKNSKGNIISAIKKKINYKIILIIGCLLLGVLLGIYIISYIREKEIFTRNQQCLLLLPDFKDSIINKEGYIYQHNFDNFSAFYSPITKSCLGIYTDHTNQLHSGNPVDYQFKIIEIGGKKEAGYLYSYESNDCVGGTRFFKDIIRERQYETGCNESDASIAWNNEIKRLKGL